MIGAIQSTGVSVEPISKGTAALPQLEPQTASPPESPPVAEQITDLLESHEAAENAIIQAKITLFREGLDISKSMSQQMLKMLDGVQLLARNAPTAQQSTSSLDVIA